VSAGADFLVTGDRALLALRQYAGIQIISAREFLTILEQQPQSDE
jgi:predicted nucleic acid-binding protein